MSNYDRKGEDSIDEVEVNVNMLPNLSTNDDEPSPDETESPPNLENRAPKGLVDFQQPSGIFGSTIGKMASKVSNLLFSSSSNLPYTANSTEPIHETPKLVCGHYVFPCYDKDNIIGITGKPKGIQGFANSCYLDTILFAMFSYTTIFDKLILVDQEFNYHWNSLATETQRILRDEIVNPLREYGLTPAKNVMILRDTLYSLNNDLVGEEMDPLEFLQILFARVLKLREFVSLSTGLAFSYDMIVHVSDQCRAENVPTIQELLEYSFQTQNIFLTSEPNPALFLTMPRHGHNYRSFEHGVIPSLTIDITNLINHGSPKRCSLCEKLATEECPDCAVGFKTFCRNCSVLFHSHSVRREHKNRRLIRSTPCNSKMDLLAVICIPTNHFSAFVRCGLKPSSSWVYFDSMADVCLQTPGKSHSVPEVKEFWKMEYWLTTLEAMPPEERRKTIPICDPKLQQLLKSSYIYMYAPR